MSKTLIASKFKSARKINSQRYGETSPNTEFLSFTKSMFFIIYIYMCIYNWGGGGHRSPEYQVTKRAVSFQYVKWNVSVFGEQLAPPLQSAYDEESPKSPSIGRLIVYVGKLMLNV